MIPFPYDYWKRAAAERAKDQRERTEMKLFCSECGHDTDHVHLHDEAHGIAGTHLAGSERYVCQVCGKATFATSRNKSVGMDFRLDGVPCEGR